MLVKRNRTAPQRAAALLRSARNRKPLREMSLTVDWIQERLERGVCEVSHLPFVLDGVRRGPWSPSLDRINPEEGYTPANTRVVVWAFNTMKSVFTDTEVFTLAEALCTHAKR